jgi:NitT/TauT family transport system substrate-binding protein
VAQINIQFTLFSAFYSPVISAISGGFLAEEGLEPNWSISPPGVSAIAALEDGSAHVVQSALSQGFTALDKGEMPSAVHFAQVNEMDGFFISARDADDAFDWHKLEDAEVVIFGGGQPNAMLRYACHRAGIDFSRIRAITPGGADAIDQAFRAGQGQYVQQQGPYPQQLDVDGVGHVVAQVGPLIGPCAFSSLAASRDWLDSEMACAFTRAYANARRFLNEAPAAEIAALEQSWFPDITPSALEQCIASYQALGCWTPHVEITRPAFEVTLDVFEHIGGIPERYAYEQVCAAAPAI